MGGGGGGCGGSGVCGGGGCGGVCGGDYGGGIDQENEQEVDLKMRKKVHETSIGKSNRIKHGNRCSLPGAHTCSGPGRVSVLG